MKWLGRVAESNLRGAELLFTLALNTARTKFDNDFVDYFGKIYSGLISARRNLAMFQHHDAITGKFKKKTIE
jgi:alpha-mannosidase